MSDFQETIIRNNEDTQKLQEQEQEQEQEGDAKKKKKIKKTKQMVFTPIKTIQRLYKNNPNNKATSLVGHDKFNGTHGGHGWAGCNLCFMHPLVHGGDDTTLSSPKSQTSDPRNQEFGYEFLKVFMETNDFYSSDCNVHIGDITDSNVV